jgi:hypothetical protein
MESPAGATPQQPAANAPGQRRRVAVLICGIPPPAVLDTQGDYGAQFSALLQQQSSDAEDWRFWRAYEGELPTEEELAAFDAIVFTGTARDRSLAVQPLDG